jgi:hypothetical protein
MQSQPTQAVPTLTWKAILAFDPCSSGRDSICKKLKAAYPDYRTRALTLAEAAEAGATFDQLIWAAGRAAEADPDCARRIRLFGADCAARVAHIANDPRSTAAIVASRQFARGEIDDAARAAASDAAWAAARAAWAAASDAARAAWAAASDAASDAAWAARDAARAAARAAEQEWQRARLVVWFSADEPADWPMGQAVTQSEAA